ncbi:uncharacterized protein EV422DRAFT_536120 [Fimicolochytrium jonesii]|uniref:uncharacterized protein n=1 Tax=Fimicolochytrium jonesii TaxID=1396493 RepID=UPI0022FEE194|nr:uncharacterized protein EV422DRAFT_536120 [Fimicolochytrium jonesii]KAI8818970.1 hypothetical protein EV422DRAFT_536120 [Fimicolochytrium jonesii]
MLVKSALPLLALATSVAAHGRVTSPVGRTVGPAYQTNCGNAIFNTQAADPNGNVQDLMQKLPAGTDPSKCNLQLCKGYSFADNVDRVESYTAGQVVPITVDIRAPHTGTANVSVVDLATNTLIGKELIYFSVYASTRTPAVAAERNFAVTIPDLGGKCTKPGQCALQWWWDSREANQTYESCIDFVVAGSTAPKPSTAAPVPKPTTAAPIPKPTTAAPQPKPTTAAPVPKPSTAVPKPSQTRRTRTRATPKPTATTAPPPAPKPTTAPGTTRCADVQPQCWDQQRQLWNDFNACISKQGMSVACTAIQNKAVAKGTECNSLKCTW